MYDLKPLDSIVENMNIFWKLQFFFHKAKSYTSNYRGKLPIGQLQSKLIIFFLQNLCILLQNHLNMNSLPIALH